MDNFILGAILLLGVTVAALIATIIYGIRLSLIPWVQDRRHIKAVNHDHELAMIEDSIRQELAVVEKKVHYRHNLHCPACGRFSRQAFEWPEGVTDCTVHGILLLTIALATGPIPVIVQAVPDDEAHPETSPLYLEAPAAEGLIDIEFEVKTE